MEFPHMNRALSIAAACALPLAGCGAHGNGNDQGTTISLNANGSDGNVVAGIDGKSGDMAINAPGFSGKISLPKIHLDASNFDMNGVHLYPGSTISGMNIDAHDHGAGSDDDGTVKVTFESPARPDTVRAWFEGKLNGAGFHVKADGTGLSGTTDEQKPFSLELSPAGGDHAKGVITIG
jgi:hypothetical protein